MRMGEAKIPYEKFSEKVKVLLKENPEGLTWGDIKTKAGFPQKVPNNAWVRSMEKDIGLIRKKRGTAIIWSVNK
jgi:hypothetical protein